MTVSQIFMNPKANGCRKRQIVIEQGRKIINPSGGYPADIHRISEWRRGCQKGSRTFHQSIDKFHLTKIINWKERKSTKRIKVQ